LAGVAAHPASQVTRSSSSTAAATDGAEAFSA